MQGHPSGDLLKMSPLDQLKWNADGLVPAIVQECGTGRVLMMAWMNRESLAKTLESRRTWFWSRSRQTYWLKGESSGHVQRVREVALDCDGDTLLVQVEQVGPACHEGYQSCFFRRWNPVAGDWAVAEFKEGSPS